MADIQSLEQRFESITVQDENLDTNAAAAAQQKQKVCNDRFSHPDQSAKDTL